MILGTAGHIDHGKTALVRALTGIDTDRLPEEKRRGITIELGFAPLALEGIGTLGVVDVPGHEAFVRTMVAGATGIDIALIVVAADEGVMPQTREHLAILELLGVRNGVVALTKADLVDDEWLSLVEEDVKAATESAFPDAMIVTTSSNTGHGLPELRAALTVAARRAASRRDDDLFRLPIDRAFTIRGTGTVVTGTVWSGRIERDQIVRIVPGDGTARVRGIQAHGVQLAAAGPGSRAAIALAGVEPTDVPRGSSLVLDPAWHASRLARADVTLVAGAADWLKPRTWLRLHVGTSEVSARIVSRESRHNGPFAARVVIDEPVLLRAGDRFVLRSTSPLNTVGGGIITDPYAPKRARPWPIGLSASDRLARMVDEAGDQGLEISTLPVRLGEPLDAIASMVDDSPAELSRIGPRLVSRSTMLELEMRIVEAVHAFHTDNRLEPGAPVQFLRSRLRANPELVDAAIDLAIRRGMLAISAGVVRLKDWSPELRGRDLELAQRVRARLDAAGSEPPAVEELSAEVGADVGLVVRYLERTGEIVQTEQNRYYTSHNLMLLIDRLRQALCDGASRGPSELREALGLSRKYLIPFLEYSDRAGYTNRHAEGRVWRGA